MTSGAQLSQQQCSLLEGWLPGAEVIRDHSWGLVGTVVLELRHNEVRYIAKAGDDKDHHLARELRAHRSWLQPWTSRGRAPELLYADAGAKLLVTRYLPGVLVQGGDHEGDPETYRQAGRLLALLHEQISVEDDEFEAREKGNALAWLNRPHRIAPDTVARLREAIESWPTPTSTLVPTHGDWQPRNWLVHEQNRERYRLREGRPASSPHGLRSAGRPAVSVRSVARRRVPGRVRPRSTRAHGMAPYPDSLRDRDRGVGLPGRRRNLRAAGAPHDRRGTGGPLSRPGEGPRLTRPGRRRDTPGRRDRRRRCPRRPGRPLVRVRCGSVLGR